MVTISLCMIVKNEEAVLDRCLSSIADLMDEIFGNGQPISGKLHSMYAKELFISGTDEDFLQAQPVFMQTILNEFHDCGHPDNESSYIDGSRGDRLPEAICVLCHCMRIQNRISDFFKYALHAMA